MSSKFIYRNWPLYNLFYAAIMWGLLWYPVRLLDQSGLSGLWSTFIMFLSATAFGVYLMRGNWGQLLLYPRRLIGILLASGWCNTAFIVAIAEKDAARVVLLFYLSPVWTILLGVIFLKERPGPFALYVCLIAIVGAMLMLWNPEQGSPWPRDWVDWLALSSGFSFAILNILVRDLQQVSLVVKSFVSWLGVVLITLIWVAIMDNTDVNVLLGVSFATWLSAILLGLFAVVTMTLAVQYGVTKLPVYKSSIILLLEVAVTAISTQFLSNDRMSLLAWAGGGLIVAASLIFALTLQRRSS